MKYECFLPNSDSSAVRMINEEELDNVCSRRRHKRLLAGLDTNVSMLQLAGHTKCTYCLLPKELHSLMMEQDFSNQEKLQFTRTLIKN